MRKALLATKEEDWKDLYKSSPVGAIVKYETTRKKTVENLNYGDAIYLRVQGDGDVKLKLQLVNKKGIPGKRILELRVKHKYVNGKSAKEMYKKYGIKAGAEHGWLEEKNAT